MAEVELALQKSESTQRLFSVYHENAVAEQQDGADRMYGLTCSNT